MSCSKARRAAFGDLLEAARAVAVCTVILAAAQLLAQNIDTVVTSEQRKSFSVLDQIEDSDERAAFLTLYQAQNAPERRARAESFLETWPRSWLLAQVYEIASKAAMDLQDYPMALSYGRQSLRLFPENALLLVPLANVQVKQKLFSEATNSALEALEYLDRFAQPMAVPAKEWQVAEKQLRASAHLALGRAALSEALPLKGDERRAKLDQARRHLSESWAWSADDPQPVYLLGLTYLFLGDKEKAAGAFVSTLRIPGPLQEQAAEQLARLGRDTGQPPLPRPQFRPKAKPGASSAAPPRYAGSQACMGCHGAEHSAWRQTGMAKMLRPYQPENVFGNFDGKQVTGRSGQPAAEMGVENGRHYFATRRPDGSWSRHKVDYTIGSKWQQAYATKLSNGDIHVFPLQYNKLKKSWVNYWRMIDPPNSERPDLTLFHRMNRVTSYKENCALCHTSQLRFTPADASQGEPIAFRETGINCEMCHGPSARHVEAFKAGKPHAKQPLDPPVDFAKLNNHDYVAICGQCHMQSALHDPSPSGAWNYAAEGGEFFHRPKSQPFTEFTHRAIYKDGRLRETTFIVEALQRSACYKQGQAHCGHCHDPHPADAASNPVSLKFRDNPNQMCVQCHASRQEHLEEHTRHPASSEGSRCASCHMPRIMNSLLFQAATHKIDDIPNAAMTARFGQAESPNACLMCHRDRNISWLEAALKDW